MLARGPAVRPTVRTIATLAALVVLLVLAGLALFDRHSNAQTNGSGATHAAPAVPSAPAPSATAVPSTAGRKGPSPSASHAPSVASVRAAVNAIIAKQPSGAVSVAAVNTATGKSFSAGATSGMWTASAYKLLVLEALLWQHEQSHSQLSGSEDAEATTMIENSDNAAGYELYEDIGGSSGMTSAITAFGMSHTVPGISDPALTTTSGTDALVLLRNLVTKTSPLDAASRAYALNLMRHVESDQRWGVGVVADKGSTFYNKNGWMSVDNDNVPSEDDNGLWITTSLGIVTVHGQQVLMAVLTRHQPDLATGIALVQTLARTVVPAVAP